MRLFVLLLPILLCGCMRVVTQGRLDIAKQSLSDSKAAAIYIDETAEGGTKLAADAMRKHADNIAAALEIEPSDLPHARVGVNDWKQDANKASEQTSQNLAKDGYSISTMVSVSVILTMLAGIGLKMGTGALSTTPFAPIIGMLGTLFGHDPAIKASVHDKIITVLEDYKEVDPDWENNKLFKMLSKRMTQAEKDYVKAQTNVA